MTTRDILGVPVMAMDGEAARALVAATIATGAHERFAFLNAHGANVACDDPAFREVLARFKVLPDGAGVDIASRRLYGAAFPENLNGTDFVPTMLGATREPWTVGLWGAAPGVADEAALHWARAFPQHAFRVVAHGFVEADARDTALRALERAPVDLLLVAMGNPRQEFFIDAHVDARHARVAMGVGALLDFAAGRVPRAPRLMRRLRCEWIYRLALEPRRMWRRYVWGNPLFLARVERQRRRGHA